MKITEKNPRDLNGSHSIYDVALASLNDDKAFDVVSIALPEQTALADHMIIATGTSSRHVGAMAGHLKDRLAICGVKNIKTDGMEQSDWVVIDAGDIVVHIFKPETREFYDIERMWASDAALLVKHEPQHTGFYSSSMTV